MGNNRDSDSRGEAQVRALLHDRGVLRSRDLDSKGIGHEYLRIMVERGELQRVGRGLYAATDADISAHHTLALCARRIPDGVICLLSALEFHELGTSLPWQVWMAIGVKAHKPKLDYPSVRVVRFSTLGLCEGIETHQIEGVEVKITSPARTVVDCFRYRNKIGLDVALEALQAGLRFRNDPDGEKLAPLCSREEIWQIAGLLRAANVIRPYLEAYSAQ